MRQRHLIQMLRPSPKHEAQRLPNDDSDDKAIAQLETVRRIYAPDVTRRLNATCLKSIYCGNNCFALVG